MRLEVQTGGIQSNSITTERPGTAKYPMPKNKGVKQTP